jgi:carbonic anhydrase
LPFHRSLPKEEVMAVIDELVEANQKYAKQFDRGHLPMPPRRHVAIVTCMDARIVPSRQLGLEEGDAHVIRNAGGRARDALRSLVISQRLLGTNEVASSTTPTAACSPSTTRVCAAR